MRIKVIVFDLWNTLVWDDSEDIQEEIASALMFPDRKSFWKYCDKHFFDKKQKFTDFLTQLAKTRDLDKKTTDRIVELWIGSRKNTRVYPHTIPTLEKLKKRYKLVLLSNTAYEEGNMALEKFNLRKYFDVIIISCEIGLAKPNPEFFKLVLNRFNVEPFEVCIIGDDYELDIIPSKKIGFKTILLDRKNKYSQTDYVDVVISSLDEIRL